jgi:ubiquitin carboxyl-terminal hydrolase 1
MSSQEDHLLRDLYGGDLEYHPEYRAGDQFWPKSIGIVIPIALLGLGLFYTGLVALDFNLLPLPELLWNCLVYITPSRVLALLENGLIMSAMSNISKENIPQTHAAKSESMRRIFGLDKTGGIMGNVAQAGRCRLSSLPGINMVIPREDGGPPGLGNWDNSCYQNSVLQGLASLYSMPEYLQDPILPKVLGGPRRSSNMKMTDSLRNLIADLKDPLNNGKRIWTPATLKSMSSWQQQDAQEYYSKVMDQIDKEIAKAAEAGGSIPGLESERSLDDLSEKYPDVSKLDSISTLRIRNPLEGLLAQRVGCTRCGCSEGLSMIPFNCLTVPLGRASCYDISQCLEEYTKLEAIEGVECGRCTLLKIQRLLSTILDRIRDSPDDDPVRVSSMTRLQAVTEALEEDDYDDKTLTQKCNLPPKSRLNTIKSRQAVIARPPKSLAVHINRSLFDERTGELQKNSAEVRFPKRLDLGPWCLGSTGATDDAAAEEWLLNPDQSMIAGTEVPSRIYGPIYELCAVVTHYGRHENGHYVCYRKHPVVTDADQKDLKQEQWWRLSDDDVMKVSEQNVLGQGGVFMLFYDCIEAPSLTSLKLPAPGNVSAAQHSEEVDLAASIPLPTDMDDDFDNTASIDDNPFLQLSRQQSSTANTSEFGDEPSEDEPDYRPTKAILIPPRIQSSSIYLEEENKEQALRSPSNMVMV